MATQRDLQELLRLLTGTRKLPMLQAMTQVKALQAANLRSIKEIAEASPKDVESALSDAKAAKLLQSACKAVLKRGESGGKRPASGTLASASAAKRSKRDEFDVGPVEMTPQELEDSLELPIDMDEERIVETVIQTNRAPVVLAFAVELLRYTMPEQPLSSRLSLAQAVVSANSRSKAVSLGLDKGPSADEEGYGEGQPRVRIMGREVTVLKRGGYEWRGDETVGEKQGEDEKIHDATDSVPKSETQASSATANFHSTPASTWAASQPISLKSSTFIARAAHIDSPSQKDSLLRALFEANPKLKGATHNAWAYRIRPSENAPSGSGIREASFDDGETGCGDLMQRILREVNAVDTIVVLSRWFGGIFLGPDRFRLMRNCVTSALAERLRRTGAEVTLGGEALWGLDLEGIRSRTNAGPGKGKQHSGTGVVGMEIHKPEGARSYLLKSFPTVPAESPSGKSPKKSQKSLDKEKEENLGLFLGALRLVLDSWADHLTPADLDKRAWSWYCAVRPEVESGPSGWGAKGTLKLKDILDLRKKE